MGPVFFTGKTNGCKIEHKRKIVSEIFKGECSVSESSETKKGVYYMKKTISRLPDSELDIMLVLWNHEPPMGRLEIERVVNEKKKLAPTTILSLLTRLEKKGFVSSKKEGKMNLYTPLVTQEEYQQQESRSVLEKLYGNSLKRFVNALYQGEKMKKEDIQELSDFLKEMEEDQEE